MSVRFRTSPGRAGGFTIIELMIAIALSIVVVGAVTALVAASARANSETIGATRLTQELRSLGDIVARELRRARYQEAAVADLGNPCSVDPTAPSGGAGPTNPFQEITVTDEDGTVAEDDGDAATADGDCVVFGGQQRPLDEDGDGDIADEVKCEAANQVDCDFRAIFLGEVDGRGTINFISDATAADASCGAAGAITLSSELVDIRRFELNWNEARSGMQVAIVGRLMTDPDGVERRFSEFARVRSGALPDPPPPGSEPKICEPPAP
ncbi:MAG TPA: hypothetical protein VFO79_17250 [Xanthomonadales bacterium]|nr:hypothetical protein [Xanthomonadales bacterium]